MTNWLWDNKEWLFSGAGAVAVTTLFTVSRHWIRRRQTVSVAPLKFDEVMQEMGNVPPLQIEVTGARFKGIMVRWSTSLLHVATTSRDEVAIALDGGAGTGVVNCTVKLSRYKALSYMRRGEPITIIGTIERVEPRAVQLRDVRLMFRGDKSRRVVA